MSSNIFCASTPIFFVLLRFPKMNLVYLCGIKIVEHASFFFFDSIFRFLVFCAGVLIMMPAEKLLCSELIWFPLQDSNLSCLKISGRREKISVLKTKDAVQLGGDRSYFSSKQG